MFQSIVHLNACSFSLWNRLKPCTGCKLKDALLHFMKHLCNDVNTVVTLCLFILQPYNPYK